MSVTPGPWATPSSIAERPLGHRARVEDRVHVADEQDPRRRRAGPSNVATTVSPSRPVGSGRRSTVAPSADRNAGDPAADLVDAVRRVRAAVDVDEALEVGEVARQVGLDRRAQARRARRSTWTGGVSVGAVIGGAVYAGCRLAILPGPCAWSRSACSRARTSTGSSRWSRSRSPSGGGGPGTASATRAPRAGPARARACRPGSGRTRSRPIGRLDPPAARGPRRGSRRPRRPPLVRPGHWIVSFPWVGAERARTSTEAALALADRDVSPSRTAQLTGAQERLLARWTERIAAARTSRRRRGSATPTGACPIVSISGTNGKTHGDPDDHPHPAAGRPARRDDDLGRRARRRADGRARRLDRARRRAAGPRPVATSTSPSSRPPAAASSCAGWATSRTTRAS